MMFVSPTTALLIERGESALPEGVQRQAVLQEMEHLFANELLKELRKTIPEGGLFDGGREEEIYNSMLDDVFAQHIASSGQLEIAKSIDEQLRAGEVHRKLRTALHAEQPKTFELEPVNRPAG